MSRFSLQAIGLLLLLATFFPLTGTAEIVSALAVTEACSRCCEGDQEKGAPGTCTAGDCACYLCLSVLPHGGHRLSDSASACRSFFPPPGTLWPAGYTLAIDYPPERS